MHRTTRGTNGGTDTARGRGKRLPLIIAAVILAGGVAIGAAGWHGGIFQKTPAEIAKAAGVVETADAVRIPLSTLESGKTLFLESNIEGSHVYFFVMRSSDGVYRAAYDACDVCFRSNRGYRQEGDLMVCNNCGQAFPSVKVNEVKGGCNPAPLNRMVDGDSLLIRKVDLAAGKGYFPGKRS